MPPLPALAAAVPPLPALAGAEPPLPPQSALPLPLADAVSGKKRARGSRGT